MTDTLGGQLTVAEVARQAGLSPQQIRLLIHNGTLPAWRPGRDYLIAAADLPLLLRRRRPGRPVVERERGEPA
jgi:excisionase family DNA binding protein